MPLFRTSRHIERQIDEFLDAGWIRFVAGGAEVGEYLAHHPGVDRVHGESSCWPTDAVPISIQLHRWRSRNSSN